MASKKQSTATTVAEVGAGLAAVAAAAGATYWFYGTDDAKKHRKAASTWAKGMKNEVVKEAKKVKKLDQKAMATIVDRAAAMYATARSVDKNDLKAAAAELKKNWKAISTEVRGASSKVVSAGKGAVKAVKKSATAAKKNAKKATKTAKKSVKKAPKKAPKKASKRSK